MNAKYFTTNKTVPFLSQLCALFFISSHFSFLIINAIAQNKANKYDTDERTK